jgi:predicted metal-dependent enzyme (double-stranded beta helix superfamily)
MLFKSKNGFEAMAARWSPGAISSIHGHPSFTLYFVAHGKLLIDNYEKDGTRQVKKLKSGFLSGSEFLSFQGDTGTFDNHIHQVHAIKDTLSIHVSSEDATNGEIFN